MRWPDLRVGPDGARYLALAQGRQVSRPFHLRRLLPAVCGVSAARWWIVWLLSWPLAAAGFIGWQSSAGWQTATIGAVLLLGLPGILGPSAVIPVGVDLPATALTLCACWAWHSSPVAFGVLMVLAAATKETAPVFAALWLWSPWPLLALIVPLIGHLFDRRLLGPDPLGARFDDIAAHPVRTSLEHHRGVWRDGWQMVAPWGVCLLALHSPTWQTLAALAVAYGLLLVATDTVRLYQHAAGPVMAAAAAPHVPISWAVLVLVCHVMWWRTPARV